MSNQTLLPLVMDDMKKIGRWALKAMDGLNLPTREEKGALMLTAATLANKVIRDERSGCDRLLASWLNLDVSEPSMGDLNAEGLVLNIAAAIMWAQEGFPTFRLSSGLAHGLQKTEVNKDIVEMPFGTFLVLLPTGLEVGPEDVSTQAFIYCREVLSLNGRSDYVDFLLDLNARLEATQAKTPLPPEGSRVKEIWDGAVFLDWVWAEQGIGEESRMAYDSVQPTAKKFSDLGARMRQRTEDCEHLAKNLGAYLSMRPEDWPLPKKTTTKSRKAKKLRQLKRAEDSRRTWNVGKEIELPEHLLRKVHGQPSSGGTRSSQRLSHRVFTQGHFRRQAIGKGWKDHKTIWIQPHYKGPEDGEVAEKRYHAKTLEEAGLTDA